MQSTLAPTRLFATETVRKDAMAGVITGLMAIPSTIGICLLSDYPIQTGLVTVVLACVVSFITFLFRVGNFNGVPGVAAGLAPLLALGVHTFGMHNMPFLIMLVAVMQALIWRFDWGKFVQKVIPAYLVEGLLAGIGLKVVVKFLPFTWNTTNPSAVWLDHDRVTLLVVAGATMLSFLYLYGKYSKKSPAIPYLTTIAMGIFLAFYAPAPKLHIEPVSIHFALPLPNWDEITPLIGLQMFGFALVLASVDVIEQVMSNVAIGKLDPYKRPVNSRNSLLAIWMCNFGSSLFGGMTNLDGLQMSSTNIIAGAVTKLSNLFTAATILFFLFNVHLMSYLPEFLIGGLMVFVGWKMIAGMFHVADHGRYAFILSLFCAILVFQYGIFEGLLIVIGVHAFIFFIIEKYKHTPTAHIIAQAMKVFSDSPGHAHDTPTMHVEIDPDTGGLSYRSHKRDPSDKKSLREFLLDWGAAVNSHSVTHIVGHYDAQAMLWGTFASNLSSGHDPIRKYFEHLCEMPKVHVEFTHFDFRQYGNIYIQSGAYTFTYEKRGKLITVPSRYSFVCKKERTGWFILEHHSSELPA